MYAPINNFNNLLLKTVRSRKWTCARGPCNKGAQAEGMLAGGTARRCEAGPQPPDTGGGGGGGQSLPRARMITDLEFAHRCRERKGRIRPPPRKISLEGNMHMCQKPWKELEIHFLWPINSTSRKLFLENDLRHILRFSVCSSQNNF